MVKQKPGFDPDNSVKLGEEVHKKNEKSRYVAFGTKFNDLKIRLDSDESVQESVLKWLRGNELLEGLRGDYSKTTPLENFRITRRDRRTVNKEDDERFHGIAIGFRTVANALQEMMNQPALREHPFNLLGYVRSVTMVRALSAECMLKAVCIARSGFFKPTHDLLRLWNALDENIRKHIDTYAEENGVIPLEKILSKHRRDFVGWRYPIIGEEQSTQFHDLDKAIGVLRDVYSQIKAGNAPQ